MGSGMKREEHLHTGPEFIEQSGGRIQGFCDFVGSGGTFEGKVVATTINDSGLKYLSTDLWE